MAANIPQAGLRQAGLKTRLYDGGFAACRGSACRNDRPRSCSASSRGRLLGLDHHRQVREPAIVKQPPERLETETAGADVLVAIDAAAARALRIVGVEESQAIEADDAIEEGDRVRIAIRRHDVVSGRDEMTRVEADADTRRAVQLRDDRRQVLEAISQRPSLPRRVLEQHHRLPAWSAP